MAKQKNKNASRIVSKEVMGIILNMALRHGSRSSLGVYLGGNRGLVTMWDKGYGYPSPAAQAALISLSNGELEYEDFVGYPIKPRPGESMFDFIKRQILAPKAEQLKITVEEYLQAYVPGRIRAIIRKKHLHRDDITPLTTVIFNDRSFWLKVYRRFIKKHAIYDKNNRCYIESQELPEDVPRKDYRATIGEE
ncbi:hypothetical protein [Nitrospira sp. BLG_2]|uniref:hypothetical protein n=1 Tax=Nitrospira sp. BLG_2 TaxID=3397507 RepID=UPI003B9C5152